MTRWTLSVLATVLVLGLGAAAVARTAGWRSERLSVLVAVVAQWLAAYVLWSFAGGLALRWGVLVAYEPVLFTALALPAAVWHYRTRVTTGPERARVVFVAGQLVWLVIVLARNGLFAT